MAVPKTAALPLGYAPKLNSYNIKKKIYTVFDLIHKQLLNFLLNKLEALSEVNQSFVEVTFDPPWNPEMITEEAKKKLGLGITKPENHDHITINEEWE